MRSSQTALPDHTPVVAWDPRRGVFLINPDHPEWASARARYDQLVLRAPPIVRPAPGGWRHTLRRWKRNVGAALNIFLGRQA